MKRHRGPVMVVSDLLTLSELLSIFCAKNLGINRNVGGKVLFNKAGGINEVPHKEADPRMGNS
jgi:hypothetical protein